MDFKITELNNEQQEEIYDKIYELDNPKFFQLEGQVNIGITSGDGSLVAGLLSGCDDLRIISIYASWVDEAYNEQGLGKKLFDDLELQAKQLGANTLQTHVYSQQYAEFYRKMGFTEIGNYTHPIDGYTEWFFVKFI